MTDEGHNVMRVSGAGTSRNNPSTQDRIPEDMFFLITYIINGPAGTKNRKQTDLTGLLQYSTSARLV